MSQNMPLPWLKEYPESVRPNLQYPEHTLYSFLEQSAEKYPDHTAIIYYGRKITYSGLHNSVNYFASSLAGLGVVKGDRVALMLPNCPQSVIAYYAILRLGAVVVPINPVNVGRELVQQMCDVGCRIIIYLDTKHDTISAVLKEAGIEKCIVTGLQEYMPPFAAFSYVRTHRRNGKDSYVPDGQKFLRFSDLLAAADTVPAAEINPVEDLAVLQYTGGTTGTPKAAMLTHFNLTANILQIREWFTTCKEGREVILCVLPFFHVYGMTMMMNFAVHMGATMVLLPRFDTGSVLSAVERYGVTVFGGIPAMYAAITADTKRQRYNLSSLHTCVSGAEALPSEVAVKFEELTGVPLVEGYGLTETSPVTHCNLLEKKPKTNCVGLPLSDTECKIVDLESGEREMPHGVAGELIIRGPQVMKGYWKRPEETAETLRDGWLFTGDIARLDKSGYTYIVDRKKDMIISGGYNIYPQEVEAVLLELPQVADVAVVGIPELNRGEIVKAYIVLTHKESLRKEEILAYCRERLAAYKIPRLVEFRHELPKTATGKTLRRMLIEEEKRRPAGFD